MPVQTGNFVSIGPMKKVSMKLNAGTSPGKYNFTPEPVTLEFIYGISGQGMTGFELQMKGKREGDTVRLTVTQQEARPYFGALFNELTHAAGVTIMPPQLYLEFKVTNIKTAENREVVKAMAKSLGHGSGGSGCGGSCDCGC